MTPQMAYSCFLDFPSQTAECRDKSGDWSDGRKPAKRLVSEVCTQVSVIGHFSPPGVCPRSGLMFGVDTKQNISVYSSADRSNTVATIAWE